MRTEVSTRHNFCDQIGDVVRDLLADSRDFTGTKDAGLERFLDRLLSEGGDAIAALMKDAERKTADAPSPRRPHPPCKFTDYSTDIWVAQPCAQDLLSVDGLNEDVNLTFLVYLDLLYGTASAALGTSCIPTTR